MRDEGWPRRAGRPGNIAMATAPWQRRHGNAGGRMLCPGDRGGPAAGLGPGRSRAKDSAPPGLPGRPRQRQAPASAGVPRKGIPTAPSQGLSPRLGATRAEKNNKATPSSATPHFTRSHELLQTGSCFARCPLRARPSPARPGAAPPAGSDAPRGRGTTNEVAGTRGTDSTGGNPPATAAVLGQSHAPTCEHARAPSTHRAPSLALQLFPALLMPLFPPSQGKPVTFCLLPA